MLQARQSEPIVRQGQLKRRRRKHYDAPAKQDTSKRPPLDCKSQWHGNENTQPSKTLRLRSKTTRRVSRSYDSRTGPTKTALADPSKTRLHDESQWHTLIAAPRTVANGCELWSNSSRTRPTPTYKREPFATHSNGRAPGAHGRCHNHRGLRRRFCILQAGVQAAELLAANG